MSTQSTYQLTRHPVGTLREMWAISWPLMMGFLSGSLMFFADRFILAHASTQAMNAAANAGLTVWMCLMLPLAVVETAEIFVGKANGQGSLHQVATPVWQMLWLTLMITPIFWIGGHLLGPLLFANTGNTELELDYFITQLYFAPCLVGFMTVSSFFIGIGRMHIVTIAMIAGNLCNIALDCLFVFGYNMSSYGAALATGISECLQLLFCLSCFLSKKNRSTYKTSNFKFDFSLLKEFLRIALPSGIGRMNELIAHVLFFRILIMAGGYTMTCATVVQSLYLLMGFIIDGLAKGSAAVVSNIFGAEKLELLPKVVRSAMKLHSILFVCIFALLFTYSDTIATWFFSSDEAFLAENPDFLATLRAAALWMSCYFLFDGYAWVMFGIFTAAKDTKFVMYVNALWNWLGYILPVYLIISVYHYNADSAWMCLAFYNAAIVLTYYTRYRLKIRTQIATQEVAIA